MGCVSDGRGEGRGVVSIVCLVSTLQWGRGEPIWRRTLAPEMDPVAHTESTNPAVERHWPRRRTWPVRRLSQEHTAWFLLAGPVDPALIDRRKNTGATRIRMRRARLELCEVPAARGWLCPPTGALRRRRPTWWSPRQGSHASSVRQVCASHKEAPHSRCPRLSVQACSEGGMSRCRAYFPCGLPFRSTSLQGARQSPALGGAGQCAVAPTRRRLDLLRVLGWKGESHSPAYTIEPAGEPQDVVLERRCLSDRSAIGGGAWTQGRTIAHGRYLQFTEAIIGEPSW